MEPEKKIDQLNVAGGIANARTQTEIPKMKSPSEACSRSRSADISVTTPLLWALLLRTSSLPSVLPNLGVPIFRLPPRCSGLCCSGASFAVRAPDLGVPTFQVHPVALGFAARGQLCRPSSRSRSADISGSPRCSGLCCSGASFAVRACAAAALAVFHWRWHSRSPWIDIPVPPPLPCRSCHCSMSRLPCAIMSRLPLRLKSRLPCAINVAAAIAIDVTADSATSSSCGLAIAIDVASDSAALRPPPPVASPRGRHRGCLCDLLLLWPCHCDRCRG